MTDADTPNRSAETDGLTDDEAEWLADRFVEPIPDAAKERLNNNA